MQQHQVVVTDARLPEDRLLMEGIDCSEGPLYTVSEVAKFFFAKSAYWIRWRERSGAFVLDGKPVGTARTPQGARVYDLSDIEKMAHALASQRLLDGMDLQLVLYAVYCQARLWGFI